MVIGIGTDIVTVKRFASWEDKPKQLRKIFSDQEIAYCTQPVFSATQFAARFAAKEAFFKALSQALVYFKLNKKEFSLLFACKHIEVIKGKWDVPEVSINWGAFEAVIGEKIPEFDVKLSISHEATTALAFVIITDK